MFLGSFLNDFEKKMDKRVCILIGPTSGIGRYTATRLAADGWGLVGVSRREGVLQSTAQEVALEMVAGDASDSAVLEKAVEKAVSCFGRVDAIVNCAGSILLKPAHLTTPEEFADVLRQNLTTAFNTVRVGTLAMTQGGSIVLMSSAAARIGLANHEAIAAAKAGVIGLTLSAAATYAARNIRVNCVAPGLVRTPMAERITGNPASEKASVAMHALGRLGEVEDVASAVCWLIDPRNAWITGQVLGVDGGLGTVRSR